MRKYGIWFVLGVILTLALVIWVGNGLLFSQPAEKPAGEEQGEKEGWKSETPPGWQDWDVAKKQAWKDGLKQAKAAVEKHEQKRLQAALRALEKAARKGLPPELAEKMAKIGLDHGLGPGDFEPLGKFVQEKHQQGLRGKDLAEAIHQEARRRQAAREKARERKQEEKGRGKGKEKPDEDSGRRGRQSPPRPPR